MLLDPCLLHLGNNRLFERFVIHLVPDVSVEMVELLELVQISALRFERDLVSCHQLFVLLPLLIVKKSVDVDGIVLEPRMLQDFPVAVFRAESIRLVSV